MRLWWLASGGGSLVGIVCPPLVAQPVDIFVPQEKKVELIQENQRQNQKSKRKKTSNKKTVSTKKSPPFSSNESVQISSTSAAKTAQQRGVQAKPASKTSVPFSGQEALEISLNATSQPAKRRTARASSQMDGAASQAAASKSKNLQKSQKKSSKADQNTQKDHYLAQFLKSKKSETKFHAPQEPSFVVPQNSTLLTYVKSAIKKNPGEGADASKAPVLTLHKNVHQEPLIEEKPQKATPPQTAKPKVLPLPSQAAQPKVIPLPSQTAQPRAMPIPAQVPVKPRVERIAVATEAPKAEAVKPAVVAQSSVHDAPAQMQPIVSTVQTKTERPSQLAQIVPVAQKKASLAPNPTSRPVPEMSEKDKKLYSSLAYQQLPATVIESIEGPKMALSGQLCSFIGSVHQEDARGRADGSPHFAFGWADLGFEVSGATPDEIHYKYFADLQIMPNDVCMNDNYVEVATPFGTAQFGNLKGVESALLDDASSLDGGTCGVDGSVWDLFNRSAGLPNPVHLAGFTKRATKLTLYTPRLYGFKLGLSYTPNPGHSGWDRQDSTAYQGSNSNDDDVFHNTDMHKFNNLAYGINFERSIKDLSMSLALVATTENTTMDVEVDRTAKAEDKEDPSLKVYRMKREIALQKDTAFQGSASLEYKNFKIAGGFIHNGQLNLPKTKEEADRLFKYGLHLGDAGKGWNIGGKYTLGCLGLSFTHHSMERRVTNYSYASSKINTFAAECQVVSGVKAFVEVNRVETKTDPKVAALYDNSRPPSNKGTTVFVGTNVSF